MKPTYRDSWLISFREQLYNAIPYNVDRVNWHEVIHSYGMCRTVEEDVTLHITARSNGV